VAFCRENCRQAAPVWRHAFEAPKGQVPGKQGYVEASRCCRQQVLTLAGPDCVAAGLPQLCVGAEGAAGDLAGVVPRH
jgi:hypothetical protein